MQKHVIENLLGTLKDCIVDLPVMIAVRDRKLDKYVYNSLGKSWTGDNLNTWNSLSKEQRLDYLNAEDRKLCRKVYFNWVSSDTDNVLRLIYRIKSQNGEQLWIQCRFEKCYEDKKEYIIEISWNMTQIINKLFENNSMQPQLYAKAIQACNQAELKPSVIQDILERFYDRRILRNFTREVQKITAISTFLENFPNAIDLYMRIGWTVLQRLEDYMDHDKRYKMIRNDLYPSVIADIMIIQSWINDYLRKELPDHF